MDYFLKILDKQLGQKKRWEATDPTELVTIADIQSLIGNFLCLLP